MPRLWRPPPSPQDEAATHIIVYRLDVDPDSVTNEFVAAHGLRATHIFRYAIKGTAVVVPPGRLAALQRDPRVAYVEANQVFHAHAQTLPTGVDRINADIDVTAKINGVDERVNADIAILDSGIDLTHPDLNLYRYTNCTVGSVKIRLSLETISQMDVGWAVPTIVWRPKLPMVGDAHPYSLPESKDVYGWGRTKHDPRRLA